MGENRFSCSGGAASAARETFGIETSRILDACRDRDCFEDVRVFLTGVGEELIARILSLSGAGVKLPVLVSGDRRASLGSGIELLEKLKAAGMEKVSFQVSGERQSDGQR